MLVTETEAPALTLRGVGENLKLLIVIALAPDALGAGVDVAVEVEAEVVDELLDPPELPQPASSIATPTTTTSGLSG